MCYKGGQGGGGGGGTGMGFEIGQLKHLGEKNWLISEGKCVPCTCMRSKGKELDNPKSFIAFCFLLLTAALFLFSTRNNFK